MDGTCRYVANHEPTRLRAQAKGGTGDARRPRSSRRQAASLYNAMPMGAERARRFHATFEKKHGKEPSRYSREKHLGGAGLRAPAAAIVTKSPRDRPGAILLRSADMHEMDVPSSVKAVARAGAGTNNIPVAQLSKRGIPVFNAPGANANAVKELVIAGMFLAARNICPAWEYVRGLKGNDEQLDEAVEKGKKKFVGYELPGRTLGVIGLGAIGVEVANAAHLLGMRVLGFDPQITVQRAWQLSSGVEQALSLDDLFARSDMITVHVPLLEGTRGLVNAARLRLMRNGSVIMNFARNGIVDEAAVLEALGSGKLNSYVCDFPTAQLKDHAKVVALPPSARDRRGRRELRRDGAETCAIPEQGPSALRQFPQAILPRTARDPLSIANENVRHVVQISTPAGFCELHIARPAQQVARRPASR